MNSRNSEVGTPERERCINRIVYFVLAGFFCFHWWFIWRWAVDAPFWDEWHAFPQFPALPWLFSAHNEHRIVTTRLLTLVLWWLNGWNIAQHQVLNFAIYGGVVLLLGVILRRAVPGMPGWIIGLGMLYLLSPMNHENHFWAFQTQWHFTLLFLYGAAYFWFKNPQGEQAWKDVVLGGVSLALGGLSLSGGVAASVAVGVIFLLSKWRRLARRESGRGRELVQFLVGIALPVLVVLLHFATLKSGSDAIPRTSPLSPVFWAHFLSVFASAASGRVPKISLLIGAGALIFMLLPWGILWKRRKYAVGDYAGLWMIGAIALGLLAALAAISMGRASLGSYQAFAPRYREFTMVFVPLSVAVWWCVLEHRPRLRTQLLSGFAVCVALVFLGSFRLFGYYQTAHDEREAALAKLLACSKSGQACEAGVLSPYKIQPEQMVYAKQIGLSFVRNATSE